IIGGRGAVPLPLPASGGGPGGRSVPLPHYWGPEGPPYRWSGDGANSAASTASTLPLAVLRCSNARSSTSLSPEIAATASSPPCIPRNAITNTIVRLSVARADRRCAARVVSSRAALAAAGAAAAGAGLAATPRQALLAGACNIVGSTAIGNSFRLNTPVTAIG